MDPARQACALWGHIFQKVLKGAGFLGSKEEGRTLECPSVEKEETSPQQVHYWEHGQGRKSGEKASPIVPKERGLCHPRPSLVFRAHGLPGACPFPELQSSKATSVLRNSAYENVFGAPIQSVRVFTLQACHPPEFDPPDL